MTRPARWVIVAVAMATIVSGCSSAGSGSPPSTPAATSGQNSPRATGSGPAGSPTARPTSSATPRTPATTSAAPSSASPSSVPTAGTATGTVRVDRTIATGLNVPWGLALLPDGDLLVTSRDTKTVTRINLKTGRRTLVATIGQAVSNVTSGGEAGLLGIALSPTFSSDHRLYLYYSTAHDNRIARFDYDSRRPAGQQLINQRVILTGIPLGVHHDGGRIAFGPDGMLYASTGEAGDPALAQQKSSLGGKILRMTADGKPAPGNPFPDSVVWTYGHRNVQGLAWDPAGRLWASEFGDRTADELNLIKPGHNYGWPATQGRTTIRGYTSPVAQWGTEVDSPSGIAYAAGSIWMAALKGERLWRIPLKGSVPVARPTAFLTNTYGRLRSVLALNNTTLLLTTSNTDGRATPKPGDDRILLVTVS